TTAAATASAPSTRCGKGPAPKRKSRNVAAARSASETAIEAESCSSSGNAERRTRRKPGTKATTGKRTSRPRRLSVSMRADADYGLTLAVEGLHLALVVAAARHRRGRDGGLQPGDLLRAEGHVEGAQRVGELRACARADERHDA